jgi:hypothetical protein
MISQASIESLSDILDLESSNFVRYIQEVAELRPSRSGDAEAVALFAELYLDSSANITELSDLLADHAAVFPQVAWDMGNARYHFIRPVFLLAPLADSFRDHLETLGQLAEPIVEAGWEAAQQAVDRLRGQKSAAIERIESLAQKLGGSENDPPERRGSSASRW